MTFGPIWLMQPIPFFGEKLDGLWLYEPKIDGWRMQILRYPEGHVECWGRRLERKPNWSRKLVKIVHLAKSMMPKATILDCELFCNRGRQWIPSLFAKKPRAKPIIHVFDVICFDEKYVHTLPLIKRKILVRGLKLKPPFFLLEGKDLTNIKRNYHDEIKRGYEGIVIKKSDSPYLIGKEAPIATHYWRKIK